MVESMIERVARAIRESHANGVHTSYADDARAAIAAMREPTDAMVGAAQWAESEPLHEMSMDMGAQFKAEWRAAIDAALSEPTQ